MIKNKSQFLPLSICCMAVISIFFLSISAYGVPSYFLGKLDYSKIQGEDYGLKIPSFNDSCLYEYHDGQEILQKFLPGDNYHITIRKSYTDNSNCYGKIVGSNLPQRMAYAEMEEDIWVSLSIGMKQGVPMWSQEPTFLLFLFLINASFLLAYRSKKMILLAFIFFIFYSTTTFDKHNKYLNGIDSVIPNQQHIQNMIDQLK